MTQRRNLREPVYVLNPIHIFFVMSSLFALLFFYIGVSMALDLHSGLWIYVSITVSAYIHAKAHIYVYSNIYIYSRDKKRQTPDYWFRTGLGAIVESGRVIERIANSIGFDVLHVSSPLGEDEVYQFWHTNWTNCSNEGVPEVSPPSFCFPTDYLITWFA